jgi:hypothetical protein
MLLEIKFFSINDIYLVPLCGIILYAIIRNRAKRNRDPFLKRLYFQAFYFKLFCVFAFVLITEFYFGGGDTGLYYQGVKDLRAALTDDTDHIWTILNSTDLLINNPLAPYFLYDGYAYDITFNYMRSPANFFMPRLGLIPSFVFFNSYICISLCFSFFAMVGGLRLFKTFYAYYPLLRHELAIAIVFLPSVGFWSAGLMKDTICFGCVGFFVYGVYNIFFRKANYLSSIIWLVISGYLLYTIKTYIFLVLLLAMVVWIFAETNKMIKERTLRQIFALMTFVIGVGVGFFLLQYFTSQETLQQYQFENIVSSAEYQRSNYEAIDQSLAGQSSYYRVNTSNPFLLVVNGIVAVFFRPFIWEINSAAAVLSAIEALGFLLLTGQLFFKKGILTPFKQIVNDPRTFMCFIFAIVFAIGVGASTANFGALSRYKIPCMPFYMVMLILLYNNSGLGYPKWFKWILLKTSKR